MNNYEKELTKLHDNGKEAMRHLIIQRLLERKKKLKIEYNESVNKKLDDIFEINNRLEELDNTLDIVRNIGEKDE